MNEGEAFSRYRSIVEDWGAFQAAIRRPLPKTLWTNTLRLSPEALRDLLGVPTEPLPWWPAALRVPDTFRAGHHWAYLAGLFNIQEEVSMLPPRVLDLRPGERALDLCAAPGNKTAQLGVGLSPAGTVVANDRSTKRMRAAAHTFERLGLLNVATTTVNAARFPRPGRLYDKVLADVPCSGEGTCRRSSRHRETLAADSEKLSQIQIAILRRAVDLCRVGGRIVYSTCTFAPEENEWVVDTLLRERGPALRLLPASPPGFHASPGLRRWRGRELDPQLVDALRVWPHQRDTGGFFVAVLERCEDPAPVATIDLAPASRPSPARAAAPLHTEDTGTERSGPSPVGPEERRALLGLLTERFGIAPEHFADLEIVRPGRKSVYITSLRENPEAPTDSVGMRFIHTNARPTLTTAAAIRFGALATVNAIDLDREELRIYLRREDQALSEAQARGCEGTGSVIVRYRGFAVGLAVYHTRSNTLESHYPKSWARASATVL